MRLDRCCCYFDVPTGICYILLVDILLAMLIFGCKASGEIVDDRWNYVIVVYLIVRIVTALLGFFAVYQKLPIFLVPFLVISIVTLIATTVVTILWPDRFYSKLLMVHNIPYSVILILTLLVNVLSVYFIVVILNYMVRPTELPESEKNPKYIIIIRSI